MTAAIIPFDFEEQAVRVVMQDETPWFVAADVCRVLEHSNPTVALSRLDDEERQMIDPKQCLGTSVAGGGAQMMSAINESGLYALILTSRKPAAICWITSTSHCWKAAANSTSNSPPRRSPMSAARSTTYCTIRTAASNKPPPP